MTCALAASPIAWVAIWNPAAAACRPAPDLRIGMELQPARVGLVRIGLLEPRAARAERAVGEELDPDHPQPVAVQPGGRMRHCAQQLGAAAVGHQPDAAAGPPRRRGGTRPSRRRTCSSTPTRGDADSRAGSPAPWPAPGRSAAVGAGMAWSISLRAVSTNRPFSIARRLPRAGVAAVTPAAFIAALLATTAWPSTRSSTTGRPGTTESRSAAVGKRLSGHSSWFQPQPDDPGVAGCAAA